PPRPTPFPYTTLFRSAPEPDQLTDRLEGGDWRGIELALMPQHVASDDAVARAVDATRAGSAGLVITAEAPVAWPSGAFVRVDRLDRKSTRLNSSHLGI